MSLYLGADPVGVCDRCKMKRKLSFLTSDPNAPGLMVCSDTCVDKFDPYRLTARRSENITLKRPRPDTELV